MKEIKLELVIKSRDGLAATYKKNLLKKLKELKVKEYEILSFDSKMLDSNLKKSNFWLLTYNLKVWFF